MREWKPLLFQVKAGVVSLLSSVWAGFLHTAAASHQVTGGCQQLKSKRLHSRLQSAAILVKMGREYKWQTVRLRSPNLTSTSKEAFGSSEELICISGEISVLQMCSRNG